MKKLIILGSVCLVVGHILTGLIGINIGINIGKGGGNGKGSGSERSQPHEDSPPFVEKQVSSENESLPNAEQQESTRFTVSFRNDHYYLDDKEIGDFGEIRTAIEEKCKEKSRKPTDFNLDGLSDRKQSQEKIRRVIEKATKDNP